MSLAKLTVVECIRTALRREAASLTAITEMARDEATHGQSRPENQYDTRALEASYLAAGQGKRLEELRLLVAWFEVLDTERVPASVRAGALVSLEEEDGGTTWILVAPSGGMRVQVEGSVVSVISPASSLGSAIAGLAVGDAAEVRGPRGVREVEVLSLQ